MSGPTLAGLPEGQLIWNFQQLLARTEIAVYWKGHPCYGLWKLSPRQRRGTHRYFGSYSISTVHPDSTRASSTLSDLVLELFPHFQYGSQRNWGSGLIRVEPGLRVAANTCNTCFGFGERWAVQVSYPFDILCTTEKCGFFWVFPASNELDLITKLFMISINLMVILSWKEIPPEEESR